MLSKKLISEISKSIITLATQTNTTISVAESCTGGMAAEMLTDVPGSSCCFSHGIVSYSNQAKIQVLGVDPSLIENEGAVSEKVARSMAEGVLRICASDISAAITGIAGPSGGTEDKPIGTVCFAWSNNFMGEIQTSTKRHSFKGNRESIRMQAVEMALQGINERMKILNSA